ncbi:hypothetical protein MAR_013093 [Mya arenaria]|uniref:FYVE-type domain-containing protein n=1 Tax=Mya arenaria TaxID=6604 RepID=A0ABY7G1L2_MYAAR|nr:hypothetical protein MAR_013093 [Mya arenaria]
MEEDKSDIQSEIEFDISSKEYHAAITRSHYVDVATRTCCQNKACGIVCMSCYEERSVCLLGVTRSVTDYFLEYRGKDREEQRQLTCDLVLQKEKCTTIRRFWRDQLTVDIYKECQRLIDGFSKAVGTSDTMMALTELRKILSVPSWQKSTFWQLDSGVTECRGCGKRLGSKRKHNCRVCGLALCKHCSVKELLLYFTDDKPDRPRLAIIRLEGRLEHQFRTTEVHAKRDSFIGMSRKACRKAEG